MNRLKVLLMVLGIILYCMQHWMFQFLIVSFTFEFMKKQQQIVSKKNLNLQFQFTFKILSFNNWTAFVFQRILEDFKFIISVIVFRIISFIIKFQFKFSNKFICIKSIMIKNLKFYCTISWNENAVIRSKNKFWMKVYCPEKCCRGTLIC